MTLGKVGRAVKRTGHSRHLDGMEDALLGIPKEPEPGGLGLPDPTSLRFKLHQAMEIPKYPHLSSKWNRDHWKRALARANPKLLGIRPSHIAQIGIGWAAASPFYPLMTKTPFVWDPLDTAVVGGAAVGTLGWKIAADKVRERKMKRLARMKRRLKRARREEMGDSTPPIRERMAEPPFYTDSPSVVMDNQFKRRNRNQP